MLIHRTNRTHWYYCHITGHLAANDPLSYREYEGTFIRYKQFFSMQVNSSSFGCNKEQEKMKRARCRIVQDVKNHYNLFAELQEWLSLFLLAIPTPHEIRQCFKDCHCCLWSLNWIFRFLYSIPPNLIHLNTPGVHRGNL